MKITRYEHACLLIEESEKAVLVDPGSFAWESEQINLFSWPQLNEIVVTHEHGDHFYQPFVEALIEAFPQVRWVTNQSVASQLHQLGARNVTSASTEISVIQTVPHERLPSGFGEAPPNIQADILGRLTHPGDSHSFTTSQEILAMPLVGPWGSMTAGVDVVMRIKPKVVIPIHDSHWQAEIITQFYERLKSSMAEHGVRLVPLTPGESIEL